MRCMLVDAYHFLLIKMAESLSTIVPKKKVVSPVWDYFGLRADNEGRIIDDSVAVCQCNGNVRASGGNTSNFHT